VAIKIRSADATEADMKLGERFENEAMLMARLSHPHIVNVYDAGVTSDGLLYYVMEHVEGRDIAQVLAKRGRLLEAEVRKIAQQVAEALIYAHEQGIVHRDIKPANVLVGPDGVVKVADFGLAKILAPGTVTLTRTATHMGSYAFVAPEVFTHGAQVDQRADVYSFGVMLYQMLTGLTPHGMFKLPSEHVPELEPHLDEVICKALEQDREERYQTMAEMMAAMLVKTEDEGRRPLWRRWSMWVAAVVMMVMALLVVVWPGKDRPSASSDPGEWQDVFSKINLTKHRLAGKWRIMNGDLEIVNEPLIRLTMIELPILPAGAFDLKVTLTRLTQGAGSFHLPFRFREHAGVFTMMEYGVPSVGLEMIDGKKKEQSGAYAEYHASYLPLNQRREVQLCVREEGLMALLDGREIFRWVGDWSRVRQTGGWVPKGLGGRAIYAVGASGVSVRVEGVSLRELPGDAGKLLPPEPGPEVPRTPLGPEPVVFEKNGHRYQFVPGGFKWSEAEKNAQSMGGHLATLTSQEEHDFVWERFSPWLPAQQAGYIRKRGWWIGGLYSDAKKWEWITGEPFEFHRLDNGAPVVSRIPRLIQSDNEGGGLLSVWKEMDYSQFYGFLVEWDAVKAP
jgi:hypothetical protein